MNVTLRQQQLTSRLSAYAALIRLDKPIGTLLLLWPTLWGLWIASHGHPNHLVLFIFIAGTFLMRSAGCAINDFADRDLDAHVARTKTRPVAAGLIQPSEALSVAIIFLGTAFGLVLLMNPLTIKLALVGAALAMIYPYMKRITHMPQMVLGLAFSWGIPMAFAAQTGSVPNIAWFIYLIAIIWPITYDTMYAMADRADDLKIGVKSSAILFGEYDRVIVGLLQLMLLILLVSLGRLLEMTHWYYLGLIAAGMLAIYQQYLLKDREPSKCFQAFLNNNYFGMLVFVGIMVNYF